MTEILCGKDISSDIEKALSLCKMTVTDERIKSLYPQYADGAFIIPSGESGKSQAVLFSVLEEMLRRGLKRGDAIAALGGGSVGDVTGLAAALYMRGIDWISIPTTLLAMVDSGLGGKTAIDLCGVKNAIGAFHMPQKELISTAFIKTLSDRDMLCGFGEIIKTCVLTSSSYDFVTSNITGMTERDDDVVYALVKRCADIKNTVVTADPEESGLRKILNVGHTVGHALESIDGYKCGHGEYVIKGMMTECAMFKDMVCSEFYPQFTTLLKSFTSPPRTTANAVYKLAARDKKNVEGYITVMLPIAPGDILEVRVKEREFIARYANAIKELRAA